MFCYGREFETTIETAKQFRAEYLRKVRPQAGPTDVLGSLLGQVLLFLSGIRGGSRSAT